MSVMLTMDTIFRNYFCACLTPWTWNTQMLKSIEHLGGEEGNTDPSPQDPSHYTCEFSKLSGSETSSKILSMSPEKCLLSSRSIVNMKCT